MKNFFITLLLGIILGATGYWFMQQPPAERAAERVQQQASEAGKAATGAAMDARQAMTAKLEALQLRADDMREELKQTGKVVRRKARDVGDAVADTAADTRITAEVKRKLIADPELSSVSISVNTTNGRVTLSGTVSSPHLVGKAMLLAMETNGVHESISTLQVQ